MNRESIITKGEADAEVLEYEIWDLLMGCRRGLTAKGAKNEMVRLWNVIKSKKDLKLHT